MDWRIKGSLQKVLGVLPGGEYAHYQLQRRFGGLRDFGREFDIKMDDWRLMAGHLRDAGMPIAGARMFEIGSGWYPTFPFACFLGGARNVVTVDLNRHMKADLVRACVARLERFLAPIAEICAVDAAKVRERHRKLAQRLDETMDIERATEGGVRYLAPADAARSGIAPDSVDCIFSNSVLEHVPPAAIGAMYAEARRILAPGGIMFHSVNCGDHYAYVDRSIHQLHYLRYSDAQWAWWNNAFLYQNRMRAHEFVENAAAAGFQITLNTAHASAQRRRDLEATPVHAQFAAVPPEQLCITSVDFIARKPA